MQAADRILLESGFHAMAGSRFRASIESVSETLDIDNDSLSGNANVVEIEKIDKLDTALAGEYIEIYPNPTTGNLRIELMNADDLTISSCLIVEMKGNVLKQFKNVNSDYLEIDFTIFAKGTYFMVTYSQQKIFKNKIIYE